ncbi:MAG: hypothetical protein R6W67_00185 [Bacteroidales bacterium]
MKRTISLLLVTMLLAGLMPGCKKDKGKPPVLPPYQSMEIDFSDFTTGKKSFDLQNQAKDIPDPDENFTFSAGIVGIWNTIITLNLAVPVTAFKLAANTNPVWISDKTWEWKYNVTGIAGTWKARLVGKILSDKVEWEMYISKDGTPSFAEFVWFTGTSALDGNSGRWVLNYSQEFQEPYLQIDWEKTGSQVGLIKYTYIRNQRDDRSPDPFKNSYIEYGQTTAAFNAYYTVHIYESLIIQDFVDIFIEWNTTTGEGRVKALYKFGDNNWHCWDSEKFNKVCS